MVNYFIFSVNYAGGKSVIDKKEIQLVTKRNRMKIDVGDKALLRIRAKNILATGFTLIELENAKPYTGKISLLPSFFSRYEEESQKVVRRGALIQIPESEYKALKAKMEEYKVSEFDDLKSSSFRKGAEFESDVVEFLNRTFKPLGAKVLPKFRLETDKGKREIDVYIQFGDYEILCDAFVNKSEIDLKIHKAQSLLREINNARQKNARFILFYKGNETELGFNRDRIKESKIMILDLAARAYYDWLLEIMKSNIVKPYSDPSIVACYHLLGELEIGEERSITIRPYIKLNDGNNKLLVFKEDVGKLIPLFYVARRERGKEKFYQRLLKKGKLEAVNDYLSYADFDNSIKEHGTFPNSIVISPESIKEQDDSLLIPFNYGSTAILDGQHRAYGAYINECETGRSIELYFTAIVSADDQSTDMSFQQEYFITINREQTRIDPELIWRSYNEMEYYRNSINGIVSKVASEIELSNLLRIRKKIGGDSDSVSFSGLCVDIKKMVESTSIIERKRRNHTFSDRDVVQYIEDLRKRTTILINLINEELTDNNKKYFLNHDGRLSVLFKLYSYVLNVTGRTRDPNILRPYFKALDLSLNEDIRGKVSTSGEGPRSESAQLIGREVNSHLPQNVNGLGIPSSKDLKERKLSDSTVSEIASLLKKLSEKQVDKGNGIKEFLFSSTGSWALYIIQLNKSGEQGSFYENVVDPIYKMLIEGGMNLPQEYKDDPFFKNIKYVRNYNTHDTGHGDPSEIVKKRERVEDVVYGYLKIRKLPEQLNENRILRLRISILSDFKKFLQKIDDEIY